MRRLHAPQQLRLVHVVALCCFACGLTFGYALANKQVAATQAAQRELGELQVRWIQVTKESIQLLEAIKQQKAQLDALAAFQPDLHTGKFKTAVHTMRTTGYAPLDPKAIKGFDYSGDPSVTASGQRTLPGVTVAADKSIPFGSWIWIDGLGWRRVDDRGGAIRGSRLDICFQTHDEAQLWGVRHKTVIIAIPVKQ